MRIVTNALDRLHPQGTVLLSRAAFFAAVATVTVMSLLPSDALPPMPDVSDKAQHVCAYASLAILAALSWPRRRAFIFAMAMLVILGGTIEILQLWVPGRSGEWLDLAADTAGVLAGCALFALRLRRSG